VRIANKLYFSSPRRWP